MAGSSLILAPDEWTGRKMGKYEILCRLSMGGMSEIFLAVQSGLAGFRKFVVLKQILQDIMGEEEFVRMFLDEAKITAAFNHPHIAQVYDLDTADEALFLAMEFVPGATLVEIARACRQNKEPIPIGFTLMAVRDTALALHYAHNFTDPTGRVKQVIHRDIAEKNIMVTYDGATKLLDFGIAKALNRSSRTTVGMVKGTSGYMSPEQILGETLDGRSDIFALGVVLHECLTGMRLFHGKTAEDGMLAALKAEVPPPSAQNPVITPELDAVTLKALARSRDDRYGSALEFARAVERAAAGEIWHPEESAPFVQRLFAERRDQTRTLMVQAQSQELTGEFRLPPLLFSPPTPVPPPVPPPVPARPTTPSPALTAATPTPRKAPRGSGEKTQLAPPRAEPQTEAVQPLEKAPRRKKADAFGLEAQQTPENTDQVTVDRRPGPPIPEPAPFDFSAYADLPEERTVPGAPLVSGELSTGPHILGPEERTAPGVRGPQVETGELTVDEGHLPGEATNPHLPAARGPNTVWFVTSAVVVAAFAAGAWLLGVFDSGPATPPEVTEVRPLVKPPEPPPPVREEPKVVEVPPPAPAPAPAAERPPEELAEVTPAVAVVPPPPAEPEPKEPVRPAPPPPEPKKVPKAKPAVARAPRATGTLTLVTEPWSTVYAGSKELGITPLVKHELSVGTHTLKLVSPDKKASELRVEIKKGGDTKMRVSLSSLKPL